MSQQLLSAIRRSSSSSSSRHHHHHVAAAIVASATASVWVVRKTLCLDMDETPTIPPSVLSGNNDTPAGTTPSNLSNARIRHHETTTLHRPGTRPLRPKPTKKEKKEEKEIVEPTKKTYDDLPPEDEPTHCTICMINRLGPCRPHWRKFEHCMKDNSPSDNDGDNNNKDDDAVSPSSSSSSSKSMEMCDEFMFPWLQCVQSHRHLYTLMTNHVFQREYIHDFLIDCAKKNIRAKKWEDPPVDWEPLWEYARETGLTVSDFIGSGSTAEMQHVLGRLLQLGKLNLDRLVVGSAHVPEWSPDEPPQYPIDPTTGEELPLELVDLSVPIDLSSVDFPDKENGWEIDLAYASDEKGRVLGFEQFTKKPQDDDDDNTARLVFSVQPNRTRRIVLYKIFKRKLPQQQQQQQGKDNDNEYEYFMYFSKSYALASEAYKAGIPP